MTSGFEASARHEVTPWQARYSFPTQSTKVFRQTVKLPPKNAQAYDVNSATQPTIMRFEFPADGYANMLNSYLQFELDAFSATDRLKTIYAAGGTAPSTYNVLAQSDRGDVLFIRDLRTGAATATDDYKRWFFRIVTGKYAGFTARIIRNTARGAFFAGFSLPTPGNWFMIQLEKSGESLPMYGDNAEHALDINARWELVPGLRLQEGGIHNLFSQIRVRYGSMVIEDIREYQTLARTMIDMGVETGYQKSIGNVLEGMTPELSGTTYSIVKQADGTTEQGYTTNISAEFAGIDVLSDTMGHHVAGWTPAPKTFIMNPFVGICSLKKLLPLKWMAAQVVVEFWLNDPTKVFLTGGSADVQYSLSNPNYITELMEFDSTYDAAFFAEIPMGIPLKFDTFNHYDHQITGSTTTFQIPERSRSVKFILGVINDTQASLYRDSEKHYHALGEYYSGEGKEFQLTSTGTAGISEYQFRIGGKYSPAQPVNCANGASEAYAELLKVIDYLGDYGKSNKIHQYNWSSHHFEGGSKFIMAVSTESNDVSPDTISGLNAEEQNDIALMFKARNSSRPGTISQQALTKKLNVFTCVDSLLILKTNNNVQLVK